MDNQLFFHIGIAKAASTYLQENFFPQLGLTYANDLVKLMNPYDQKVIDIIHAERKIKPVLCSNEGLYSPRDEVPSSTKVASLKKIYENPKIIIILRNQIDTISSRYTYKTTISPSINTTYCRKFICNYLHYEHKRLLFSQLIQLLYDTFSKENVLVLLFEELIKNEKKFTDKLLKFLGTEKLTNYSTKPRNVSYKKTKQIYANLLFNNIAILPAVFLKNKKIISDKTFNTWRRKNVSNFKKTYLPPLMLLLNNGNKFKLPKDINSIIKTLYAEDNQRLQKILNDVNLAELGYQME